jgi:hypothetical protein
MKTGEKFFKPDFKPRMYCVFDIEHTLLTGPIWHAASKVAKTIPSYASDCSHPKMVERINSVCDDLRDLNGITTDIA